MVHRTSTKCVTEWLSVVPIFEIVGKKNETRLLDPSTTESSLRCIETYDPHWKVKKHLVDGGGVQATS
jgi:hypothetical protein